MDDTVCGQDGTRLCASCADMLAGVCVPGTGPLLVLRDLVNRQEAIRTQRAKNGTILVVPESSHRRAGRLSVFEQDVPIFQPRRD